jgi:tetratricopeptide (TPR) repeat protein
MYLSFLISDNLEDDDDDDFENNDEGGGQILPLFKENPTDNLALRYFAKADFLMFQNNDQEALKYLDSLSIFSPLTSLNDDVLYRKATIATKQKDYFAAEKYYLEILQYYSSDILADDALFKLAELYEYYLVNIPESMAAYQRLLKDYPGSIYVVDARKRYRYLRGDQIE